MSALLPAQPTTTTVEPLKVIANIIQSEMQLTDAQVALTYQNYKIPSNGLYVVVSYLGPSQHLSSKSYFDHASNFEVQESVFCHHVHIELMSIWPDQSARTRKEEISMALNSFYSLQQQGRYLMGIAWLQSDITDTTALEETAFLNRYAVVCTVNALHRKVKPAPYFDTFGVALAVDMNSGPQPGVDINLAVPPYQP